MCVLVVGEVMLGKVTTGNPRQKPAWSPRQRLTLAAGSILQTPSGLRGAGLGETNRGPRCRSASSLSKACVFASASHRRDASLRAVLVEVSKGDRL